MRLTRIEVTDSGLQVQRQRLRPVKVTAKPCQVEKPLGRLPRRQA
jgi:hypothetical protein